MSAEEPQVVAILSRNPQGEFQIIDGVVYLRENDEVVLLPVEGGVIVIVGPIYEKDESVIDKLLKNYRREED